MVYQWADSKHSPSHNYLLPTVLAILRDLPTANERKLFDLGCGNGSLDAELEKAGWNVTGVDASEEGIAQALKAYPQLDLSVGSAYDDLAGKRGQFPVCLSLEVVEHLYDPRLFAKNLFNLTQPGGIAVLSTPYHGYLKNLAISLAGKWDSHFTALWDGGHIKFWSPRTLAELLTGAGFGEFKFHYVGRIPVLAKSMVVVAKRPS